VEAQGSAVAEVFVVDVALVTLASLRQGERHCEWTVIRNAEQVLYMV
jgi:hypothetical protein